MNPVPGPNPQQLLPKLKDLQANPLEFLFHFTQEYGPFAKIPVPGLNVFNIAHPEAIKHILQDNAKNYSKKTLQYTNLALVTGQGLLTSDGDFWLRQRRLSQPAFHRNKIAGFGQDMLEATQQMLEGWERNQGHPFDLDHAMMELSLRIVGKTLFSVDLSQGAPSMVKATLEALDYVIYKAKNPFSFPVFFPTRRNRSFRAALEVLDHSIDQLIETRRGAEPKEDLLQMLLDATDQDGSRMSPKQLRDELITIIIAGHETVASALTWAFHLLATHPEKEEKLLDELQQVMPDGVFSLEKLPSLVYTKAVFDETLRLYPPAWVITRHAKQADTIMGYEIPRGSLMVMGTYITQRQPAVFDQPDSFIPERFLQAKPLERFGYIPFGGGPRLCIGNNYALMEGAIVIAMAMQKFKVQSHTAYPAEADAAVTIRPKGGLLVTCQRR